jgi:non-canonical purine NTP pyrophosphatase (RdgB/HAM1 family)
MSRQLPTFITGNLNKVDYLGRTLGIPLDHHKLDLDEIQSINPQAVTNHKLHQAYSVLKTAVLVEDTSLHFTALDGLPGPFIKFFTEAEHGLLNMCRMLDGFNDRSATATAVYGYYDGTTERYFSGSVRGFISLDPKGSGGYGWDSIFEPEGYGGLTRAELKAYDDEVTYSAMRDIASLRTFLNS